MKRDPIVEEVRSAREQLAQESGHDLAEIARAARARQAASGHPVVRRPARKPAAPGTRAAPGRPPTLAPEPAGP